MPWCRNSISIARPGRKPSRRRFHSNDRQPSETSDRGRESLTLLAAEKAAEQELRDYLASFGFRGERVFDAIGPFSGGEKARLVLALISYLRPNLLLLDEPTNHLDLEMRQALALALQEYAGAVLMVSHDRHLLRTVVDQFYIVADGFAKPFDGDLEDYAKWSVEHPKAEAVSEPLPVKNNKKESSDDREQRKREDAERRKRSAPLKSDVDKLEAQLSNVQTSLKEVESSLTAADIYAPENKQRLKELLDKQIQLKRDIDHIETRWLSKLEEYEQATSTSS